MNIRLCLACVCVIAAALALPPGTRAADAVTIAVGKEKIDFKLGKALVTTYHIGEGVAKPYFWPLLSPGGLPLTRSWPMDKSNPDEQTDHVHQKSLWFCHGDVIPEGIDLKQKVKGVQGVDFWSEGAGHGRIVCTTVSDPRVEKNHGVILTANEWRTADGLKVLEETRTVHLHNLGSARLLVLEIDLRAVVPVTFGDTKEGSLGVRVRTSMTELKGKGSMTNADGHVGEGKGGNKDQKGCWGVLSNWCDYSGPADKDKVGGVTIFADPANPFPTCWHSRGYGLMAANPFGRAGSGFPAMADKKDLVKLAKGEHLKLRYGVLLHDGDVKEGKVAEHFAAFVKLKG